MKGALIILAFTVAVGLVLFILDRKKSNKPDTISSQDADEDKTDSTEMESSEVKEPEGGGECCGLHLVCEKELTAIAEDKILYYDDEELDRFAGRTPDEYNAEEIEEFREVMLTLLPHDVPGWARSLDRREIRPPREIRDELLLLMADL